METINQSPKQILKSTSIIYFAILFGQIAFMAVFIFLYLNGAHTPADKTMGYILLAVAFVFTANGIISGRLLFNKKVAEARNETDLTSKLTIYRNAIIIWLALLEAACFFSLIGFYLTGRVVFIGAASAVIIYSALLNPISSKMLNNLQLSISEKMKLGIS